MKVSDTEVRLKYDVSIGRPYVTENFQKEAFDLIHNLSHPGKRISQKLLKQRFGSKSMSNDCTRGCKAI